MGALEDLEKSVALDDQEIMATEKGTNVLEQLPEEELRSSLQETLKYLILILIG